MFGSLVKNVAWTPRASKIQFETDGRGVHPTDFQQTARLAGICLGVCLGLILSCGAVSGQESKPAAKPGLKPAQERKLNPGPGLNPKRDPKPELNQGPQPVVGWLGSYVVGRWAEVVIDVDAANDGEYEIRVTAPDPDGNRVTFSSSARLTRGRHPLRGFVKVGQMDPRGLLNPEIEVEVVETASGKTVWSGQASGQPPLDPGVLLNVTVGNPPGFDWEDSKQPAATPAAGLVDKSIRFRTVAMEVDELPVQARAYDPVSLLVIAGHSVLSAEQADAVRDWVAGGGRMVISLPATRSVAEEILQPFARWLPVSLAAEPVIVSEFGKLEFFARKNVRIPFRGRMPVPGVKINEGEVLAGSRDEALLVRSPFGLGSVTVLALDLTQPPLSNWSELTALGRRLAERSSEATASTTVASRNLQLSSTGITDLATQLHAVQEDFAGVTRASQWLVMGLLALFLLAIGPVDYLLVHRVLKWPRGTWITFPLWVMLTLVLATGLADRWNGNAFRVNQLNVVNFDVGSSTCHQRLWTNVYSPVTERRSVVVASAIMPGSAGRPAPTGQPEPTGSADKRQSGWSGIAETAFGGMLRPAGVQVGRADYRLAADATIDGLPLMQWSSKPLMTEIHSTIEGLVESDLQSNGVGQLAGTLTHRFPGPIEDWFLAYGNRVYRYKKSLNDNLSLPLAPRTPLRIDQPNMFPRELRAFLTGKAAVGTQTPGSPGSDFASQFTRYDPLSRDPAEVLRILTFHDETGGSKYTGLTNRLLETEDLSHLLKLGRAILFGRLDASVATVQLDGKPIAPDREITFVRIVLPVKKVGGDIRRLPEPLDK